MMENHSSCSYKQEKEVLKLDSMPLAMTCSMAEMAEYI